jgi:hypothetical protein
MFQNWAKALRGWTVFSLLVYSAWGQVPTGAIDGRVLDESGAVVAGAAITVRNKDTGATRTATSGPDGTYSAQLLPAGEYEVRVEVKGFRSLLRNATVETGSTTTADLQLQVGAITDIVTVESAAAQISYDSHKIDGVITRKEIQELPLNGRSFMQLAFLEPGITVSTQSLAQYNAQFSVSVLGASSSTTAITVDGGNVRNAIEGGSGQNFSQEVVQEFQISSVNMDLSTGIAGSGAVNIVTRSGGNDFHGSGYFFFRDHNMAAYPALQRNALAPDPFFARRQAGFWFGGPIVKNRAFFFVNLENNSQAGLITVQPNSKYFQSFTQNQTTPYHARQISPRFDFRINDKHNLFLRYSHDGNHGFGPSGSGSGVLPSNWLVNTNWADQTVMGLTSTLRASLVNDFRFTYGYWQNRNLFPTANDCKDCIGLGFPQVQFIDSNLYLGNTSNATQGRDLRRFVYSDNMTWMKGKHNIRFGGSYERAPGTGFWGFADPAVVYAYGPDILGPAGALFGFPAQFKSNADLAKVPVYLFVMGIGDPSQPPPYNVDTAKLNNRYNLFVQDSFKIKPRLTLNYGLGWIYESTIANHDLPKPAYLKPLLGADGIAPTKQYPHDFSPSLGFAYAATKDNKTVIRGGMGLYYDTRVLWQRLQERAAIGPLGNGRQQVYGSSVLNQASFNLPGLPIGTPLEFRSGPAPFTLGQLMAILPAVRAQAEHALIPPGGFDTSTTGIEVSKAATNLIPYNYPTPYSLHWNFGVQRELRHDLVLSVDFVERHFVHLLFSGVDYNRFNRAAGPVIPKCTTQAQIADRTAQCSTGPITFFDPSDRSRYRGMLVKVDKRYANKFQFTASYALQDQVGTGGNIVNLDNRFQAFGPQGSRHILNVSGVVDLPWKFSIGFISSIATRGPFMPTVAQIDLNGDGSSGEPLPGLKYNDRGLTKEGLQKAVDDFNSQYAGKTFFNTKVPTLTLPQNYDFGKGFSSQDIRVTKKFQFRERWNLSIFAEMFNVFNIANLGGYSNNLSSTGFGQATSRASQVFGSGGPRALQVAARFQF